jgi:hypothetical protein
MLLGACGLLRCVLGGGDGLQRCFVLGGGDDLTR